MIVRRQALAASLYLMLGFAQAQVQEASPEQIQVVPVNGMKHPEMRSYRNVVAGLDVFDEKHALAPNALLRFRLIPALRGNQGALDGVTLNIVGDDQTFALPLEVDGTFAVPRIEAAYKSNADMVLNRKSGILRPVPEIRTPGLPQHQRRLGDLRLECQVWTAIHKREMGFVVRTAVSALLQTGDWCDKEGIEYAYFAAQPLKSATLVSGERKLKAKINGTQFLVPIGDTTWPDDALVELNFGEQI